MGALSRISFALIGGSNGAFGANFFNKRRPHSKLRRAGVGRLAGRNTQQYRVTLGFLMGGRV